MAADSPANISKTSMFSGRSRRSGKSLTQKIRELGVNLPRPIENRFTGLTTQTLQYMVIKVADGRLSNIAVMVPDLNLEQIVYYQPEKIVEESSFNRTVYKIEPFETKSSGPREYRRISDIEVKSFKPAKKIKIRKRKRRSSVTYKIEQILNREKGNLSSPDPSEESIYVPFDEEPDEVPKEINDLPEAILQKIFLWLMEKERILICPRVCKLWYSISKNPIFWKELEFSGNKVPTEVIIRLLKTYPTLQKLHLTSVPDIIEILQELCRCNHEINELAVKNCNASSLDFSRIILHIISCCTNIEVLNIKGMKFQSEKFYLELGRLRNLRCINLSDNKLLRGQELITLAVNCRHLQDLRILNINVDSTLGTTLRDEDVIFIATHLQQNLNTLKMDMHQLGNTSYQAILKCSNMKCLALKNCLLLTSDVFRQFSILKNLRKLKINRAINLKADDFQHVFSSETMRNIRELDLNGCWNLGDNGVMAILTNLHLLRLLSFKNCKSVKKLDLLNLSHCSQLVELNIAHTELDSSNIALIPDHVKNLKILVIAWDVSPKVLKRLTDSVPGLTIRLSYSEYQKDERILNAPT